MDITFAEDGALRLRYDIFVRSNPVAMIWRDFSAINEL
ncbi:hypothetical protein D1BOALGB6SA_1807 [Olavius sp. associated proteobacterium Delta 1]|nr:hypothetical protein D1BOALGB6SA_1807 [Olavius sp. associated proteobacterium Delta 1]